jgi:alpha-tubulin suppressor-like RCC1 family protein
MTKKYLLFLVLFLTISFSIAQQVSIDSNLLKQIIKLLQQALQNTSTQFQQENISSQQLSQDNIIQVSSLGHDCILSKDGTVKCWGDNSCGEIGIEGEFGVLAPVLVDRLKNNLGNVVRVVTRPAYTYVHLKNGEIEIWGLPYTSGSEIINYLNEFIKSYPQDITQIIEADDQRQTFACVLLKDRTVKCKGHISNIYDVQPISLDLTNVVDNIYDVQPISLDLTNVVEITSGHHHACALLSNGEVKCWGENKYGQLGNEINNNSSTPVLTPVSVKDLKDIIQISAGKNHTCALLKDGTVKCWGENEYGQLGDGTKINKLTPVSVKDLKDVIQISAGSNHTCALLKDGTVKCWGAGPLGDGTKKSSAVPVLIITPENLKSRLPQKKDYLIQLANLKITRVFVKVTDDIPAILFATLDSNGKCFIYKNKSKALPCPISLKNQLKSKELAIVINNDTNLLLRNNESLKNKNYFNYFFYNAKINVYGYLDKNNYSVNALNVKNLDLKSRESGYTGFCE